ncbi:MAG: SH3 domain-containing protein [Planctomycetes bacterium]|nr:SH3 domain-containing protein [Planctomycetota bacterium]
MSPSTTRSRLLAPVVLGLGSVLAPWGADATPPTFPVYGTVKGDEVQIRSGASKNHPVVATLRRGERLAVAGEAEGWLRVRLPESVRLYVASRYLGADGTVLADRLNVRPRPGTVHGPVGQVARGQALRPLSASGDGAGATPEGWTAVAPPPGLTGWVWGELVDMGSEPAPAVETTPIVAAAPAVEDAEAVAVAPHASLTLPAAFAAGPDPYREELERAAELYRQEFERPIETMDFSRVVGLYGGVIRNATTEWVRQTAAVGLKRAERMQALRDDYRRACGRVDGVLAGVGAIEQALAAELQGPAPAAVPAGVTPATEGGAVLRDIFSARGVVDDMGFHLGREGTHKLLHGGQTMYVLRSAGLRLSDYVGRYVEVRGQVHPSRLGGEDVVLVEEVVSLSGPPPGR